MGWFDDIMRNVFGGTQQQQQSQQTQQATQQSQSQGTSGSTSTGTSFGTSTPSDLNPFANIRDSFASSLSGLLRGGIPQAPGPYSAPIGAGESNVLGQLNGQTGPGTDRAKLLSDTINGSFLPGQGGGNPFLEGMIKSAQRDNLQGLEETLGRTLPGRFALGGQSSAPQASSAFDTAAALATRGVAQANADIATNMSGNAYEAERGRQNQAVQLDQAEVDTTIKNLQAQALPRMIQDMGIQRGLEEFKSRIQSMLQLLATIGGVTAPAIANTQNSGSSQNATATAQQTANSSGQSTGQGTSSGSMIKSDGVADFLIPKPKA